MMKMISDVDLKEVEEATADIGLPGVKSIVHGLVEHIRGLQTLYSIECERGEIARAALAAYRKRGGT